MITRLGLLLFSCCFVWHAEAQYAPQVGIAGCDAISATSSQFAGWATHCNVQRGYQDIANPSLGYVSAGDSSFATGGADDYIVSLGDSGVAVLTFAGAIYNGSGADFAVFENGFPNTANDSQAFLELAFVEVSSDGINYIRFPARSNTPNNTQLANGEYIYANLINNLAGKYVAGYGTPFDLDELNGAPGLDINHITHVRIVDVTGAISGHSSYDHTGNVINDPYPTPFPTGGFDLDAVGVIHLLGTGTPTVSRNNIKVYPNPAADKLTVAGIEQGNAVTATLTDVTGKILLTQRISTNNAIIPVAQLTGGLYYLICYDEKGDKWVEKITKL